jgi:MoaA/NifB/PqqE/SkfB family radical SAM enzyme
MNLPIKFNPKIKLRTNNPDFVLAFDSEKNNLHEFNSTASEFILLLKKNLSKNEIINYLIKKYKLSKKQSLEVSEDFDCFLDDLIKLNIIIKNSYRMVHLFPTLSCNLCCSHCYVSAKKMGKNKKIEFSDLIHKKVIEFINANDFKVIHIEGGEPLCYSRIFDLIKKIKNKEALTLVTNGLLVEKKTVKKLIAAGLKKIVISLDGSNNDIYSIIRGNHFDETIQGLNNLKSSPIYKMISFTLHEGNKNDFEKILKIALKYNINEVRIGTLLLCGKGKNLSKLIMDEKSMKVFYDYYEKVRKKYKKIKTSLSYEGIMKNQINTKTKKSCYLPCDAGSEQIAIGPEGEIYPCYNLVNSKDFIIGNIKKNNSFQDLDTKNLINLRKQCPLTAAGHLYLGDLEY